MPASSYQKILPAGITSSEGTATAEVVELHERDLGSVEMSSMQPGPITGDHPLPAVPQAPFYAVHPKTDCPHVESNVAPLPEAGLDASAPCSTCQDPNENWVCLKCYRVFCSRYISGDMAQHLAETGHKVALSFADMSVWCDGCDSYITHEMVRPARRAAYYSKFGEHFPENSDSVDNSAVQ